MIDWTDEFEEEVVDMLHVLVKKHNLKSGDISPEDHVTLCQIASRYINNNKVINLCSECGHKLGYDGECNACDHSTHHS